MRAPGFLALAAIMAAAAPASAAQHWTRTRIVGVSAVTEDPDHPVYRNIFWHTFPKWHAV